MFRKILKNLIPSQKTILNTYKNDLIEINKLAEIYSAYNADQIQEETAHLRTDDFKKNFNHIRQKAFALVKVASERITGRRPYDVQIISALALSDGKISEMRTGEGKTLVAAMPAYLFALQGQGVHVITVNDYLAKRDAEDIGPIHEYLGLSVGVVISGMSDIERKEAYAKDITYATNSEIGFDFLRDNLRINSNQMVQRGHHFAIVDEADSILIDEARTPLIISSPDTDKLDLYPVINKIIKKMPKNLYKIDLKDQSVVLTEEGLDYIEEELENNNLMSREDKMHDGADISLARIIDAALKAYNIFTKDKDYIVQDDKVVIVDSFTGRLQPDRRFNNGIHQALEAKENVTINTENMTLSSITYQNLFRMYKTLSGMTGTADTEKDELEAIYKTETVIIPTNKPIQRIDEDDQVYLTENSKLKAIVELIIEANNNKQPILIGTPSVEKSELIAQYLIQNGFNRASGEINDNMEHNKSFNVLNALNHSNEASIIAQAGRLGAITVATNMAGRGTDIQLGGHYIGNNEVQDTNNNAVQETGGLLVIGTERNESRRIDNQLRGRSGRQGDPGRTIFFVSLEDEIIQTYGRSIISIAKGLGLKENDVISHPMISKSIQQAQLKVEARNREIRMNVIKYDDIINEQRKSFRNMRNEYMEMEDVSDILVDMREEVVDYICENYVDDSYRDEWDLEGLKNDVITYLNINFDITPWENDLEKTSEELRNSIYKAVNNVRNQIATAIGEDQILIAEKTALMMAIDKIWRKHNEDLEELKTAVSLRIVAQRDPLSEFKTDALLLFQSSIKEMGFEAASHSMRIRLA